jgi:hypothetical protein
VLCCPVCAGPVFAQCAAVGLLANWAGASQPPPRDIYHSHLVQRPRTAPAEARRKQHAATCTVCLQRLSFRVVWLLGHSVVGGWRSHVPVVAGYCSSWQCKHVQECRTCRCMWCWWRQPALAAGTWCGAAGACVGRHMPANTVQCSTSCRVVGVVGDMHWLGLMCCWWLVLGPACRLAELPGTPLPCCTLLPPGDLPPQGCAASPHW